MRIAVCVLRPALGAISHFQLPTSDFPLSTSDFPYTPHSALASSIVFILPGSFPHA